MKTTDGGTNWYDVKFAPVPSDAAAGVPIPVRDIFFADSLHGWLAAQTSGVYETKDAGETWTWTSNFNLGGPLPAAIFSDAQSGKLFVTNLGSPKYGDLLSSSDDGKTWTTLATSTAVQGSGTGFSFFDNTLGIAARLLDHPWLRTTDAGNNWSEIPITEATWQPLALPATGTFFAFTANPSEIYQSTNAGSDWEQVSSFPFDSSAMGCIRGDSCHLIVQLATGAYVSMDQGHTWSCLNGPPPAKDIYVPWIRRFCYRNGVIYMAAQNWSDGHSPGHLWRFDLGDYVPSLGLALHFEDGARQKRLRGGTSVKVSIISGAGTLSLTDSVTLTLRYDPDALEIDPSALQPGEGVWISNSVFGLGSVTLTLRSESAASLPNPLLHAVFHSYLSPSEHHNGSTDPQTFIYLDSAQSYIPRATPCTPNVLLLGRHDSVELDFIGCGDATLVNYMDKGIPFSVKTIYPNPATNRLNVEIEQSLAGSVRYQIVAVDGTVEAQADELRTSIDTQNLRSGAYYLRLERDGYVVTKRFLIAR